MLFADLAVLAAAALVTQASVETPRALDDRLVVELVAAEPDIVTPCGLAIEGSGRVLVVESHTHFRPLNYNGPPADRVLAFDPASADPQTGRIRPTVFHEGAKYTMAVGVHPKDAGAVYVATRREILLLRDMDGDGRADQRTQIATLKTLGDYPHNGLSGFAFDFDGQVVFGLGENLGADYTLVGSDGTSASGGGEGGSVYRCRPDGSKLVRLATGFWNPFAVCFDAFGRLYAVDNDPDSRPPCRLAHIVPGGDYGYRYRNGRKGLYPFTAWNGELPGTLGMVAGTGEAPSGVIAYESDNWPDDYRGNLLVTSWGDHRLESYRLVPRGASFHSIAEPVIAGGENFRPVGIATAPDGTVYVSDWVDKSYDLHGKGRLWRVRAKTPRARVVPADPRAALAHADSAVRASAANALVQQGESGVKLLGEVLRDSSDPRARAAALVALVNTGSADKEVADRALRDLDPNVGALAARILPAEAWDPGAFVGADVPALVRADALRRVADPRALPAVLEAVNTTDPFLAQACRAGLLSKLATEKLLELARNHESNAETRLAVLVTLRERGDPEGQKHLESFLSDTSADIRFATLEWIHDARITRYRAQVEELLAKGAATRQFFEGCLATLARFDRPAKSQAVDMLGEDYVLQLFLDKKTPPEARRNALRALRPNHPELTLDRLAPLLDGADENLRLEAIRTIRQTALPDRFGKLAAIAANPDQPMPIRLEAIMGLAAPDLPVEAKALLFRLAAPGANSDLLRMEALRALRAVPLTEAEKSALVASADSPALKELADRFMAPIGAKLPKPLDDLAGWLALLEGPADASAGERIFFHPSGPGCYRCHQIEGRGGAIGPDLSATSRSLDRPRLVDSILQPSKEMAPRFVPWSIATTDGNVRVGVLLEESALGTKTYADAKGETFVVPDAQVEDRRPQRVSIMPADLAGTMTLEEFRDLLAFLRAAPGNGARGPSP